MVKLYQEQLLSHDILSDKYNFSGQPLLSNCCSEKIQYYQRKNQPSTGRNRVNTQMNKILIWILTYPTWSILRHLILFIVAAIVNGVPKVTRHITCSITFFFICPTKFLLYSSSNFDAVGCCRRRAALALVSPPARRWWRHAGGGGGGTCNPEVPEVSEKWWTQSFGRWTGNYFY